MTPALYGTDLFGEPIEPPKRGKMADSFMLPPFTVLNAREGFWQERKAAWIAKGIKSEIGRGSNLQNLSEQQQQQIINGSAYVDENGRRQTNYNAASPGGSARPACDYSNRERGSGSGTPIAGTSANDAYKLNDNRKYAKTYNSGAPGAPGALGAHYGRRPHSGSLDERPGREPGTEYIGGDAWVASENGSGTSIFDPVLCELAYRWFCPAGGLVLDPFAGGSVRGIVASCLGRQYLGVDLRPEQLAANRVQANAICDSGPMPQWAEGDSRYLAQHAAGKQADLIFSCPPYGNLEVYSDDPRDLSTLEYADFISSYRAIVAAACKLLKPDRFACFVVGDFRDKAGNYNNFVGDTIAAFRYAGLHLYNEAILVTAVGSLPIRVGKQFCASRKLGKTHQNVLVFVKGCGKRAAQACGELQEFRA